MSPHLIALGVILFLARSNIGGVLLGALLTLIAMHLWPDAVDAAYQWVGQVMESLGLNEIMGR